jgi:hypothetical protein
MHTHQTSNLGNHALSNMGIWLNAEPPSRHLSS